MTNLLETQAAILGLKAVIINVPNSQGMVKYWTEHGFFVASGVGTPQEVCNHCPHLHCSHHTGRLVSNLGCPLQVVTAARVFRLEYYVAPSTLAVSSKCVV
jgi:hypothetical protein